MKREPKTNRGLTDRLKIIRERERHEYVKKGGNSEKWKFRRE